MQMMVSSDGDSSSRFEKSLGLLTTKFVTLLQEADGGILDLKVVRIWFYEVLKILLPKLLVECLWIQCEFLKVQVWNDTDESIK